MEAIINNLNIQPKTKIGYVNRYKRVVRDGYVFPEGDDEDIDKLKEYINSIEKHNTKMDLINIIIIIRKALGKPVKEADEYRKQLQKETAHNNIKIMNERKTMLADYDTFSIELERAYTNKEWTKYIINYLWFNYGVRNEDVNVSVVTRMKDMNEDENFLLVQRDKVKYVRNKYKTVSTYGQKSIDIVDNKFRLACKKVNGKLIENSLIGNELRKYYILHMTERDVFNMVIDKYYKDKDTEKINEYSKSRGTGVSTIKSHYNVNATEEVIREL